MSEVSRYNFKEVEIKWQNYWEKNKFFLAENNSNKPKFYCLEMFPYPPGKKMGHAGAIVSGNKGTASAKIEALTDAGANVVKNPTRIGQAIKDVV